MKRLRHVLYLRPKTILFMLDGLRGIGTMLLGTGVVALVLQGSLAGGMICSFLGLVLCTLVVFWRNVIVDDDDKPEDFGDLNDDSCEHDRCKARPRDVQSKDE